MFRDLVDNGKFSLIAGLSTNFDQKTELRVLIDYQVTYITSYIRSGKQRDLSTAVYFPFLWGHGTKLWINTNLFLHAIV